MAVSKYDLRVKTYDSDNEKTTSKTVATAGSTRPTNSKNLSKAYEALTTSSSTTATLLAYEPIDLDDQFMATAGTTFVITLADSTNTLRKTVNVTDPQDSITSAQVATFGSNYAEFTGVDYSVKDCYYQTVTHTGID